MKETIYTIPLNEAFDAECRCPLCYIHDNLENDAVEYTLGAAMMEPDFRIKSNEKGFCQKHYSMLIKGGKALPLALILQTHTQEQNQNIFSKKNTTATKSGLFSKKSSEEVSAEKIIEHIKYVESSCVICDKIDETMNRYLENLIYLWKTEADFKNKFASQKGFCTEHFCKLLEYGKSGLNSKDFSEFFHCIIKIQEKYQEQLYKDISDFVKLFDHNSDKKANENVKSSIKNNIHLHSSFSCKND